MFFICWAEVVWSNFWVHLGQRPFTSKISNEYICALSYIVLFRFFYSLFFLDVYSLFVFLRDDPQQYGVSLLTPVSDLVVNALSDGTIHFALYGSLLDNNLIGWNNSNSQSESFVLVALKAAMERRKKSTT